MNINSSNSTGVYAPVSSIPSDSIEVIFDGSIYKCTVPSEYFSATPTSSEIVNVFNGSKQLTSDWFSFHATGYPTGTRTKIPSGKYIRTHDWSSSSLNKNMRWRDIETSKGVFDWSAADIFVNAAYASGKTVFWCLGPCTPQWASARPSEQNIYNKPGMAAEPANMQDWYDFCYALASRYGKKISHYEVWNEFDLTAMYTGSNANMARMIRLTNQAVKSVNPNAKVIGPSISLVTTDANGGTALQKLISCLNTSDGASGVAKDWIDIAGIHMYFMDYIANTWWKLPTQWQRVESNLLPVIGSKPVWDTEMGMISVNLINSGSYGATYLARRIILNAIMGLSNSCYYDMYSGTDGLYFNSKGLLIDKWEEMYSLLTTKPITLVNIINNERVAAVIGGNNYIF